MKENKFPATEYTTAIIFVSVFGKQFDLRRMEGIPITIFTQKILFGYCVSFSPFNMVNVGQLANKIQGQT